MKNSYYWKLICSLLLFNLHTYSQTINEEAFQKSLQDIFKSEYSAKSEESITTKKEIIKPSKGAQRVAELLKKNREKIKRQHGELKKFPMNIKKKIDTDSKDDFFAKYKKEEDKKYKEWSESYESLVKRWDEEHKKYLKRVDGYQKNTEKIENDKEILKRLKKEYKYETVKKSLVTELNLVKSAMDFDVKDQSLRPTCGAFASVRAIEIKLRQKNKDYNLSEQYFYWASKPNCRSRKCSKAGSWPGYGLEKSKDSSSKDIPRDQDCSYNKLPVSNNETQIPLDSGCKNGVAKVKSFEYIKSLDEVVESIDNNNPVIAAITLDGRFYFNKGFIGKKIKLKNDFKDSHAKGHAVVIVGYKKLPSEMKFSEGNVCFIVANSWGIGWGRAGHACISEKWLLAHTRKTPFISVTGVL